MLINLQGLKLFTKEFQHFVYENFQLDFQHYFIQLKHSEQFHGFQRTHFAHSHICLIFCLYGAASSTKKKNFVQNDFCYQFSL